MVQCNCYDEVHYNGKDVSFSRRQRAICGRLILKTCSPGAKGGLPIPRDT